MKFRLLITSIILLILFSLKMGTGLLLHSLFHETIETKIGHHSSEAEDGLNYACHCIDDFLTPFAENPTISFNNWFYFSLLKNSYPGKEPFRSFYLISPFRGPPAFIAS